MFAFSYTCLIKEDVIELIEDDELAAASTERIGALFEARWQELLAIAKASHGLSGPLVPVVSAEYETSIARLAVIGQETYGWDDVVDPLTEPMEAVRAQQDVYRRFDLGSNYRSTPFWRFAHGLQTAVDGKACPRAIFWANLNVADTDRRRPVAVEERLTALDLLRPQIEIVAPRFVVFTTGPNYEDVLSAHFPGLLRHPDPVMARVLARVEHPSLPFHSYRTYHPAYLLRSKQFATVMQRLVSLVGCD